MGGVMLVIYWGVRSFLYDLPLNKIIYRCCSPQSIRMGKLVQLVSRQVTGYVATRIDLSSALFLSDIGCCFRPAAISFLCLFLSFLGTFLLPEPHSSPPRPPLSSPSPFIPFLLYISYGLRRRLISLACISSGNPSRQDLITPQQQLIQNKSSTTLNVLGHPISLRLPTDWLYFLLFGIIPQPTSVSQPTSHTLPNETKPQMAKVVKISAKKQWGKRKRIQAGSKSGGESEQGVKGSEV